MTFSRCVSGIFPTRCWWDFSTFTVLCSSVRSEATGPRQSCPPLNVKGHKLGQCASWGGYFWPPASTPKPPRAPETERGREGDMCIPLTAEPSKAQLISGTFILITNTDTLLCSQCQIPIPHILFYFYHATGKSEDFINKFLSFCPSGFTLCL